MKIAGMLAYLASPEAGFVTSASLTIDGGFAAGPKHALIQPSAVVFLASENGNCIVGIEPFVDGGAAQI